MPPIKGRMMGLEARPKDSDFSSIKSTLVAPGGCRRKRCASPVDGITVILDDDEEPVKVSSPKKGKLIASPILKKDKDLMRLRIPMQICKTLPSVKRVHVKSSGAKSPGVKYGKAQETVVVEDDHDVAKANGASEILGLKKRGGKLPRYHLKQDSSRKFSYMIWDVAFLPPDAILLSTTNGVFICDADTLTEKKQLDDIPLGGGISQLTDGRLVTVDRNADRINIYTPEGDYIHSFDGGDSPANVAVNSKDEIVVTDIFAKCIRMYTVDGTLIRVIETSGTGYQFRWPLYLQIVEKDRILVSDVHLQVVMLFDHRGHYIRNFALKTFAGNEVLRPHGICVTDHGDLFVIDNAVDTIEVFSSEGHYLQTLLPSEKGAHLRPKVMRVSPDGKQLVVGGMMGTVRVYSFVSSEEILMSEKDDKVDVKEEILKYTPKYKCVSPQKHKVKTTKIKIKKEIKEEEKSDHHEHVIVID